MSISDFSLSSEVVSTILEKAGVLCHFVSPGLAGCVERCHEDVKETGTRLRWVRPNYHMIIDNTVLVLERKHFRYFSLYNIVPDERP